MTVRPRLPSFRKLTGAAWGSHTGLRTGSGSDPGDPRLYFPTDDSRRIDWRVTARTGQLYVRPTIADRELTVVLAVDLSASMRYGTESCTKLEVGLAAVAALLFSVGGEVASVSAIAHAGQDRLLVPPRPPAEIGAISRRFLRAPSEGGGNLSRDITKAAQLLRRRGLVIVISDFLDPGAWARALRGARGRHEVLAVHTVDRRELTLPNVGIVWLMDPETGRQLRVDTRSTVTRVRFESMARIRDAEIGRSLRNSGAIQTRVTTNTSWGLEFMHQLDRARRGAA